jgi:hypothetical protein
MKLTNTSSRLRTPQTASIKLMPHQEAMLHRVLNIENIPNNKYGIMSDSPGSGKTYVVLSMIMYAKLHNRSGTNLIVVPHNIYTQWEQSIQQFTNNTITYKRFIEYGDIMSLYNSADILTKYDVLLTTSSYYHTIATTATSMNITFDTVFFDEIDSISSLLICPILTDMTWFISASFDINKIGVYQDKIEDADRITCHCEDSFIKESINLDSPSRMKLVCNNIYIDVILDGLVSAEELDSLNALSFGINMKHTRKIANNDKEVMEYFVGEQLEVIKKCEEIIEELKQTMKDKDIDQNILEDMRSRLSNNEKLLETTLSKVDIIRERLVTNSMCPICYDNIEDKVILTCCKNTFCEECIFLSLKTRKECPLCCATIKSNDEIIRLVDDNNIIEPNIEEVEVVQNEDKSKLEHIMELVENSDDQAKFIIFSNYGQIFKDIIKKLKTTNKIYAEFDGGNIKDLDATIQEYKYGKTNILMANSSVYGCGMNLEQTTDIIFVHAVNESMSNQMIGRAQRLGRTCRLNVWQLLHDNEN